MKVSIEYIQETEGFVDGAFLQEIARRTLTIAVPPSLGSRSFSINAIAVSAEKIKTLNVSYRNKDSVTDILSFGEYENKEMFLKEGGEEVFLGELFFCPGFIRHAAEEDKISFEHEMIYVFSHGILHLLGFDHSDEMFDIQDRVTETLVASMKH